MALRCLRSVTRNRLAEPERLHRTVTVKPQMPWLKAAGLGGVIEEATRSA